MARMCVRFPREYLQSTCAEETSAFVFRLCLRAYGGVSGNLRIRSPVHSAEVDAESLRRNVDE